jgi:CDP-glycerol glycerophosphotransferase
LDAKHIKSAIGYNKKIEILGMACFDSTLKLANDFKFKKDLFEKLGVKDKQRNKKIVFYAPTFRDFDLKKGIIDLPIKKMSELKDCIVLVRLHPLVKEKIDCSIFENDNLINVCNYPDSSDLLAICDVLITDYSSIFYQYSPLNKPIVFYPYDFDAYKELRGGFYLDYKNDLPGPICYTEEELVNTLENIDEIHMKYEKKQKKFNEKYNYLADGNASKRFVDKLISGYFE